MSWSLLWRTFDTAACFIILLFMLTTDTSCSVILNPFTTGTVDYFLTMSTNCQVLIFFLHFLLFSIWLLLTLSCLQVLIRCLSFVSSTDDLEDKSILTSRVFFLSTLGMWIFFVYFFCSHQIYDVLYNFFLCASHVELLSPFHGNFHSLSGSKLSTPIRHCYVAEDSVNSRNFLLPWMCVLLT